MTQGNSTAGKAPPFSDDTPLGVPLPHVYLSPRKPGHLYAGINESIDDAISNSQPGKIKTISKSHTPKNTAVIRSAVGNLSTNRDGIVMWRPTPTEEEINILRTISAPLNLSPLQDATWKKMIKMAAKKESVLHKVLFVLEMIGARTTDDHLVRVENRASAIIDMYEERDEEFFKTCVEFITGLKFAIELTPLANGQNWHEHLDWAVIAGMANTTRVEYWKGKQNNIKKITGKLLIYFNFVFSRRRIFNIGMENGLLILYLDFSGGLICYFHSF